LVHIACMLHHSADTTGLHAHQAAAFGRLARLGYLATTLAATGRCALLLGRLWDVWATVLAAALLAAMHWAQLSPVSVGPTPPGGTDCSNDGSNGGRTSDGSQQQQQHEQQRPQEQRRFGQAAFELATAVRLLLSPATAGLDTLQRDPVPLLINSLGKHCSIGPTKFLQYVKVLAS
jgi:hypothetical protein